MMTSNVSMGNLRIVGDGSRRAAVAAAFERRAVLVLDRQLLPAQHGVEPLNGRDHHLGVRIDPARLQVLHIVELSELPAIVRRREILKLAKRLPAKVVAVDQEQDALGTRMLDEPV